MHFDKVPKQKALYRWQHMPIMRSYCFDAQCMLITCNFGWSWETVCKNVVIYIAFAKIRQSRSQFDLEYSGSKRYPKLDT